MILLNAQPPQMHRSHFIFHLHMLAIQEYVEQRKLLNYPDHLALLPCIQGSLPFAAQNCRIIRNDKLENSGLAPGKISFFGLFPLAAELGSYAEKNKGRLAAAQIAVEHINNDLLVLPDTEVELIPMDTRKDPKVAVQAIATSTRVREAVCIIGPASSSVSIKVAELSTTLEIPQISYASTAASLASRETYPFFYRTCPSDSKQAPAIAEVLVFHGWNQGTCLLLRAYLNKLVVSLHLLNLATFTPNFAFMN